MIRAEKAKHGISLLCRALGVSRSAYYAWKKRPKSNRVKENDHLVSEIRRLHRRSRGTYGSPRIWDDLREDGQTVGRHRVARLMRENRITARPVKKWRRTTDSNHTMPVAPNLLERKFKTESPDNVWVGDITYIWTACGWVYLALIVDLYSRRVVGWALENHMRSDLVISALKMAHGQRSVGPGLVFHSDRGSQYASEDYRENLTEFGMEPSMSRKGDCWDNAVAESFFATIKRELVSKCLWGSLEAARMGIHEYIEVFYNRKRKHSTNGNLSPVDYETLYFNNIAVAA